MRAVLLLTLALLLLAVHPASADGVGVCVGAPGAGNVEHHQDLPYGTVAAYVFVDPTGEDPIQASGEPSACCFDFRQCCMCGVDGVVMTRVVA